MTRTAAAELRHGCFPSMVDVVPAGTRETARVEHFEITAAEASFVNILRARGYEQVQPGQYARLIVNGQLVMSDTDYELWTMRDAVRAARGDVLIGGLGLGLVALAILRKPEVHSVTVVEKNADVVALVEDPLRRQLTVTQSAGFLVWTADVRTWEPKVFNVHRFDYAYLDIWPNVCVDDYADHVALRRRVRRWMKKGGKVDSWQFEHLQDLHRTGRWR